MRSAAEKTKWMRGASAPLRGALLGLVLERPGHSYELANRLAVRLGETWRINVQDVYRLLKQLEDWGLVSSSEEPRRGAQRGTHPVYFPTELTEGALALWMETLVPMAPVRVALQAKLAVARGQDATRLLGALRQYERECLDLLQVIPAAPGAAPSWKALFMDCTREAVDGQLRQEIAWTQHTRKRIREYAAAE
ncbi:MAG: PadR family transcriptional regulator [Solirubrobacteraceae bacterium]